jgi:hypothetical protein
MEGSNTKLLQVVLLQNHFQNLNDGQKGDLVKFEIASVCTIQI